MGEKNVVKGKSFWEKRWNRLNHELNNFEDQKTLSSYAIWKKLTPEKINAAAVRYHKVEQRLTKGIHNLRIMPQSVIDIGVGTGHWINFFHQHYRLPYSSILAVDIVDEPLRFIENHYPGVKTTCVDIGQSKLSKNNATIAVAVGVLHHVTTEKGLCNALQQLGRVAEYAFIYPVYKRQIPQRHYKRYWMAEDYLKNLTNMEDITRIALNDSSLNCLFLKRANSFWRKLYELFFQNIN